MNDEKYICENAEKCGIRLCSHAKPHIHESGYCDGGVWCNGIIGGKCIKVDKETFSEKQAINNYRKSFINEYDSELLKAFKELLMSDDKEVSDYLIKSVDLNNLFNLLSHYNRHSDIYKHFLMSILGIIKAKDHCFDLLLKRKLCEPTSMSFIVEDNSSLVANLIKEHKIKDAWLAGAKYGHNHSGADSNDAVEKYIKSLSEGYNEN